MTNEERYRTTEERNAAFRRYCDGADGKHGCEDCPLYQDEANREIDCAALAKAAGESEVQHG